MGVAVYCECTVFFNPHPTNSAVIQLFELSNDLNVRDSFSYTFVSALLQLFGLVSKATI